MIFVIATLFFLAAPVAPTATPPKTYDAQALGSWTNGRSTFYGVGNGGACGYGNLPTSSFSWDLIAAADQPYYNNGGACGQCFEIFCVSTWAATSSTPNYCNAGKSVIIQVTDECPSGGWCSGDIVHFDLSTAAFSTIVQSAKIGTVGVIATQYRRTACPASGNIAIIPAGGNSQWYLSLYFTNIADYGSLKSVSVVCGSTSYAMTHQTYNAWIYSGTLPASPSGCGLKITDTNNAVLTSKNGIIGSWSQTSTINFGANFKNPSGEIYTESENTSNGPPVVTITVAVVVGVVVIFFLVFAIFFVLRNKERRSSVPYHQDSVAMKSPPTTASETAPASSVPAAEVGQKDFEDTRQQLAEAVQAATQQKQTDEQGQGETGESA